MIAPRIRSLLSTALLSHGESTVKRRTLPVAAAFTTLLPAACGVEGASDGDRSGSDDELADDDANFSPSPHIQTTQGTRTTT